MYLSYVKTVNNILSIKQIFALFLDDHFSVGNQMHPTFIPDSPSLKLLL